MKAAGFFLIDGDDKVLLLKERDGTWVIPGGKLHPGESFHEGAKRETLEETGHFPKHKVLGTVDNRTGELEYRTFVAECKSFRVRLSAEHVDWEWVPTKSLGEYKLHPKLEEILPRVKRMATLSEGWDDVRQWLFGHDDEDEEEDIDPNDPHALNVYSNNQKIANVAAWIANALRLQNPTRAVGEAIYHIAGVLHPNGTGGVFDYNVARNICDQVWKDAHEWQRRQKRRTGKVPRISDYEPLQMASSPRNLVSWLRSVWGSFNTKATMLPPPKAGMDADEHFTNDSETYLQSQKDLYSPKPKAAAAPAPGAPTVASIILALPDSMYPPNPGALKKLAAHFAQTMGLPMPSNKELADLDAKRQGGSP